MAESVELPGRLGILPFRNKVLLPGAIIRIRCTSPSRYSLSLSLSLIVQNSIHIFLEVQNFSLLKIQYLAVVVIVSFGY